jgi:hypothetical protein
MMGVSELASESRSGYHGCNDDTRWLKCLHLGLRQTLLTDRWTQGRRKVLLLR